MLQAIVARPEAVTSVCELACAMGVHRKTLVNRCARCSYLQPGEVIVWCRLAMVAHMLERTGVTVESIALTLGFASHTSLRNLIKRYTGRRATDIRRDGGLSFVLGALERRLECQCATIAHTVTLADRGPSKNCLDSARDAAGGGIGSQEFDDPQH